MSKNKYSDFSVSWWLRLKRRAIDALLVLTPMLFWCLCVYPLMGFTWGVGLATGVWLMGFVPHMLGNAAYLLFYAPMALLGGQSYFIYKTNHIARCLGRPHDTLSKNKPLASIFLTMMLPVYYPTFTDKSNHPLFAQLQDRLHRVQSPQLLWRLLRRLITVPRQAQVAILLKQVANISTTDQHGLLASQEVEVQLQMVISASLMPVAVLNRQLQLQLGIDEQSLHKYLLKHVEPLENMPPHESLTEHLQRAFPASSQHWLSDRTAGSEVLLAWLAQIRLDSQRLSRLFRLAEAFFAGERPLHVLDDSILAILSKNDFDTLLARLADKTYSMDKVLSGPPKGKESAGNQISTSGSLRGGCGGDVNNTDIEKSPVGEGINYRDDVIEDETSYYYPYDTVDFTPLAILENHLRRLSLIDEQGLHRYLCSHVAEMHNPEGQELLSAQIKRCFPQSSLHWLGFSEHMNGSAVLIEWIDYFGIYDEAGLNERCVSRLFSLAEACFTYQRPVAELREHLKDVMALSNFEDFLTDLADRSSSIAEILQGNPQALPPKLAVLQEALSRSKVGQSWQNATFEELKTLCLFEPHPEALSEILSKENWLALDEQGKIVSFFNSLCRLANCSLSSTDCNLIAKVCSENPAWLDCLSPAIWQQIVEQASRVISSEAVLNPLKRLAKLGTGHSLVKRFMAAAEGDWRLANINPGYNNRLNGQWTDLEKGVLLGFPTLLAEHQSLSDYLSGDVQKLAWQKMRMDSNAHGEESSLDKRAQDMFVAYRHKYPEFKYDNTRDRNTTVQRMYTEIGNMVKWSIWGSLTFGSKKKTQPAANSEAFAAIVLDLLGILAVFAIVRNGSEIFSADSLKEEAITMLRACGYDRNLLENNIKVRKDDYSYFLRYMSTERGPEKFHYRALWLRSSFLSLYGESVDEGEGDNIGFCRLYAFFFYLVDNYSHQPQQAAQIMQSLERVYDDITSLLYDNEEFMRVTCYKLRCGASRNAILLRAAPSVFTQYMQPEILLTTEAASEFLSRNLSDRVVQMILNQLDSSPACGDLHGRVSEVVAHFLKSISNNSQEKLDQIDLHDECLIKVFPKKTIGYNSCSKCFDEELQTIRQMFDQIQSSVVLEADRLLNQNQRKGFEEVLKGLTFDDFLRLKADVFLEKLRSVLACSMKEGHISLDLDQVGDVKAFLAGNYPQFYNFLGLKKLAKTERNYAILNLFVSKKEQFSYQTSQVEGQVVQQLFDELKAFVSKYSLDTIQQPTP